MPAGDRTGPEGRGPMTGWGAGYCTGYRAAAYAIPGPGRGFAPGWGRGRGWRHWAYATRRPGWARFDFGPAWGAPPDFAYAPYPARPTSEQEAQTLRVQAEWLKEELDAISKQIEELERPD